MLNGALFTQTFLQEGITEYDEWKALHDEALTDFRQQLLTIIDKFPTQGSPIEATTEKDLIEPVLQALGWNHFLTQQTTSKKGRSDIPDYLLFEHEDAKQRANQESNQHQRYRHGLAVLEAKAWNVLLDRKGKNTTERVPSNQIIRYLTSVDVQSDGRVQWGLLTNGRLWRIYYNRAKSKSEEYLEIDLPLALGLGLPGQASLSFGAPVEAEHALRLFYLLFRCAAFTRQDDGQTLHERALAGGRFWEAKVADDLSQIVFEQVYPGLLKALRAHDPDAPEAVDDTYLQTLRDDSLKLLYRLLFVLYAEDRRLLPTFDEKYDDYGLHKRLREDIALRLDNQDALSTSRDNYWHHAQELFRSIDQGDESIGLPPYNGGLFRTRNAPLLNRVRLPDATFAPLLDQLSRREENGLKRWINYRDLSVQQLGSIYERLLEFRPVVDAAGAIVVQPNIFARKTSGSYYTPEDLVKVILERTVGPLLEEHLQQFKAVVEQLASDRRSRADKHKALQYLDPAEAMLTLKICDPAMGSGHFLVSLVDYLADRMLEAIDETETLVPWADEEHPYVSPVVARIQSIRERILKQAQEHRWLVQSAQLDDKHIIRRMILKRCVYGVDKNPMAVELAKVSLWLHTFTVGAPLSFLDHHLRSGDSLFGEWVGMVQRELEEHGMFANHVIQSAKAASAGMLRIEEINDVDIAEVKNSVVTFENVAQATDPLHHFLNLRHALRWVGDSSKEDRIAVNAYLDGTLGDPVKIATGELTLDASDKRATDFVQLLKKARALIDDNQFLHWEVAFPGIWDKWESVAPTGGFDAVIGNPPWDRMKMQEVEWFAARQPAIARSARASDRKKLIKQLEKNEDPLWTAYEVASWQAQMASERARKDEQYPLLARGDINLYSLFVERAHRLVKPTGIVGLVIPSGIAADKSASEFFRSISTSGQLSTLLDFENKRVFFPDVDSRFKFCVYVAGGRQRTFPATKMAFFLHSTKALDEHTFALAPADFTRVNPNTGTAPIFRTRRDADITRRIYENFPVLHDHQRGKVWPVKYMRMFDMTNDSHLFKTKVELEQEGCYPVGGNTLKKGEEVYGPLYVGKMIWHYDHRASSVEVNEENINVATSSRGTTLEEHQNIAFYAEPQYFVNSEKVIDQLTIPWVIGFRDITNGTNERTLVNAIIPKNAVGNTLPLILPLEEQEDTYRHFAPLLSANFSSLITDYIARQKIQTTHLSWYIVEQLPLIPPEAYQQPLGKTTVADFIREQVLHLTYTAHDLACFAQDMGYEGEPFVWDEEDRRHRRAKLDALFFNLYGLEEDDAAYVLSTFPIVQRHDEKEFGRYRTRDLILNYMRALRAGDTEVTVQG